MNGEGQWKRSFVSIVAFSFIEPPNYFLLYVDHGVCSMKCGGQQDFHETGIVEGGAHWGQHCKRVVTKTQVWEHRRLAQSSPSASEDEYLSNVVVQEVGSFLSLLYTHVTRHLTFTMLS